MDITFIIDQKKRLKVQLWIIYATLEMEGTLKFKFTVLLKNDFVLVNTVSEEVEGDDIVKLIILMVCVLYIEYWEWGGGGRWYC